MTPAPTSSHATETTQVPRAPAKVRIWQMTTTEWLICGVACLGFAFDTYTLLVLTLIVRPSLTEMLPASAGPAVFNQWVGILFYIPAIAGGVFGLLGGYLIDLLGRRRILMWSILLYAICTFASAYITTPLQFLLLRCGTFIGGPVDLVAATGELCGLCTVPEQREAIIGYTQA